MALQTLGEEEAVLLSWQVEAEVPQILVEVVEVVL